MIRILALLLSTAIMAPGLQDRSDEELKTLHDRAISQAYEYNREINYMENEIELDYSSEVHLYKKALPDRRKGLAEALVKLNEITDEMASRMPEEARAKFRKETMASVYYSGPSDDDY